MLLLLESSAEVSWKEFRCAVVDIEKVHHNALPLLSTGKREAKSWMLCQRNSSPLVGVNFLIVPELLQHFLPYSKQPRASTGANCLSQKDQATISPASIRPPSTGLIIIWSFEHRRLWACGLHEPIIFRISCNKFFSLLDASSCNLKSVPAWAVEGLSQEGLLQSSRWKEEKKRPQYFWWLFQTKIIVILVNIIPY